MPTPLNPATKIVEENVYCSHPNWSPIDLDQLDTTSLKGLQLQGCQLTVVCGVSTSGKDTLVRAVLPQLPAWHFLPRATSRPPRPGEKDGVDYYFSLKDVLVWSEYGGNIYAITNQVLQQLSVNQKNIQIQGLLYGLVLKELLTPFGVKVQITYILPNLEKNNLDGSIRVILKRLYQRHPDVADLRLPSITRELRFIFEFSQELKDRGVTFIENPPHNQLPNPAAMQKLLDMLQKQ